MDKFTLDRDKTVLLVIDIQERLVPVMKYGGKVIKNTNILLTIADTLRLPIIVTEQYSKGLGKTVPEVAAKLNNAVTYEKITFSGCNPEVLSALNQTGRKKVLITGMETHVCVLQTVRDLLGLGYQVFVARDAVCSRSKDNYRNALSLMAAMGAVITNTETVFFDLMKEAGTPQFKELSQLIK